MFDWSINNTDKILKIVTYQKMDLFWQLATLVADDTATKVNVIETVYIESKDAKYKET